jgi:hypothetical protein
MRPALLLLLASVALVSAQVRQLSTSGIFAALFLEASFNFVIAALREDASL